MATSAAAPPSQSLYIQNLPDKLQKDDLKRALYMLFSTYGPVIDITAVKSAKMRGQAHVLFRDTPTATQAMRGCQGGEMFGREMRIQYSKNRSHTLAKMTGTVNQPEPPKAQAPSTDTASSAFPLPPGAGGAPPGLPPPPGLAPKVDAAVNAPSPQGVKRPREEEDDMGRDDAPMEEDDDEGAMEMSDEED